MLEKKELARALRDAIQKKKDRGQALTQTQLGREFGVKQSSVAEWLTEGRIAKKHITHLVEFFRAVVGPEHWGLPVGWLPLSALPFRDLNAFESQLITLFRRLPEDQQHELLLALERSLTSGSSGGRDHAPNHAKLASGDLDGS